MFTSRKHILLARKCLDIDYVCTLKQYARLCFISLVKLKNKWVYVWEIHVSTRVKREMVNINDPWSELLQENFNSVSIIVIRLFFAWTTPIENKIGIESQALMLRTI